MRSKPKKYIDVQLMQISLGFMIKNKHKKKWNVRIIRIIKRNATDDTMTMLVVLYRYV